jgi:hypothetical protein
VSKYTTYTAEHTLYTNNKQTPTKALNLGGGAVYLATNGDASTDTLPNQPEFNAKWCIFEKNTAVVR